MKAGCLLQMDSTPPSPCIISPWQLLLAACALQSSRASYSGAPSTSTDTSNWVLQQSHEMHLRKRLRATHVQAESHVGAAMASAVSVADLICGIEQDEIFSRTHAAAQWQLAPERACMCPAPLHTCSSLRNHQAKHHASADRSADRSITSPQLTEDPYYAAIETPGSPVRTSFGQNCSKALRMHGSNKGDVQPIDVGAMLQLVKELAVLSCASNCERAAWTRLQLQRMTWDGYEAVNRCCNPSVTPVGQRAI